MAQTTQDTPRARKVSLKSIVLGLPRVLLTDLFSILLDILLFVFIVLGLIYFGLKELHANHTKKKS